MPTGRKFQSSPNPKPTFRNIRFSLFTHFQSLLCLKQPKALVSRLEVCIFHIAQGDVCLSSLTGVNEAQQALILHLIQIRTAAVATSNRKAERFPLRSVRGTEANNQQTGIAHLYKEFRELPGQTRVQIFNFFGALITKNISFCGGFCLCNEQKRKDYTCVSFRQYKLKITPVISLNTKRQCKPKLLCALKGTL